MFFYDYETMLAEIKNIQLETEKENENRQKQYDTINPSAMMRSMQANMPKMQMPSFNMPKI